MQEYNVVNGTSYHIETSKQVIDVLEQVKEKRTRIQVDYGDVKTGKSWGEVYDITGTIGRSTGINKIPLLIHNTRSMGGGGLLDHCIVKISISKGKSVLYQHPQYEKAQETNKN